MSDVQPIEIFISSSMADDDPIAIALRDMLKAVGKRYELFRYRFIESGASPGNPKHEMRTRIRDCHAIAMILHQNSTDSIRNGILDEFALSAELNKPLFMFVQAGFHPSGDREAIINRMRNKKQVYSGTFTDNLDLVDKIEASLLDFMLRTTRDALADLGTNNDNKISMGEIVSERQETTNGIIR